MARRPSTPSSARSLGSYASTSTAGIGPQWGKRDPVVAKLQQMFPGFRPVNWSNAHEAAAWSLISTRIAMRQAQGVKDRMSRELGHEVDVHAIASGYFRIPRGSSSSKLSRGCLAARSNI